MDRGNGIPDRGSEGAAVAKPRRERDSAVICKKRRWERRVEAGETTEGGLGGVKGLSPL